MQDRCAGRRIAREFLLDALRGMAEHVGSRDLAALELAGGAEHVEHRLLDGLEPSLIAQGLIALSCRFAGLPQRQAEAGGENGRQRGGPAPVPERAPQPVAAFVAARLHEPATERVREVGTEALGTGIAPCRIAAQRLDEDRIEIDAQRTFGTAVHRHGRGCARRRRLRTEHPRDRHRHRGAGQPMRRAPGDQPIQHRTERIDVGRGRERLPGKLFGRGVVQRQRMAGTGLRIIGEAGHAEIDQARPSVAIDQQIGRLQIAMDDEPCMRVGERLADRQDQRHDGARVEREPLAVDVDRLAVDVLHDHVRPAAVQQSAIDQARDAGVFEQRENLALVGEPRPGLGSGIGDQLERCALRELAVGALDLVDLAHAAAADRAHDAPGAGPRTG
ncbi:MAG: hypothetical protein NVV68_06515 [Dokdonella sp.]|nr:hypothetical protein [Dokdonella sp.]